MLKLTPRRTALAGLAGLALAGTALTLHAQEGPARRLPKDLGGAERLLAHLATDKPLYKPGEVVYGRAALLDAFTRAPAGRQLWIQWEVRSPRGDVVANGGTGVEEGVAPFTWKIPDEQAGGEYKLVAKFPNDGFPTAEATFDVRAYRVPRLRTDLEFARKAYGPGDTVTATLKASRAEGGVPTGASVTAVATVDGEEVHRSEVPLDATGSCTVRFALPSKIGDGEGTLALVVRDGGVQETAARTIPIVVNRVKLEVFPEGGDLVAGLEGRLYFEARTPKGKPADVSGRVVDASGATLATFRSEHEGRGRVTFTATATPCFLVLEEPAGIADRFPLPAAQASGFVVTAVGDPASANDPVRLRVASTASGKVRVVLSAREREAASTAVDLTAGTPELVTLTPPTTADGVLCATVFDEKGQPRAERLVFRRPARAIQVQLVAPPRGGLRDPVKVIVRTRDASGKPVPAMVSLSAVDDAVLETVERRERAPRLPVQALLGSEVRELMDAHVYLEDGPKAAEKVDLLLGTQGWRRFAFVDPSAFHAKHGDAAARALALHLPPPPAPPRAFGGGKGRWREDEADGAAAPGAAGAPQEGARGGAPRARPVPPNAPRPNAARPQAPADAKRPSPPPPPVGQPAAKPRAPRRDADKRELKRAAKEDWAGEVEQEPLLVAVREYAHKTLAPLSGGRTDFTETLFWNAGIQTNAEGEATVAFELADSVTTFRVRADAFAKDGALGAGDATIEARRPFYVEPKLPLEVTAGDVVQAPVALVNGTRGTLAAELRLTLGKGLTLRETPLTLSLEPEQRGRLLLPLEVGGATGDASVRVEARTNAETDDVTRTMRIVPAGFPIELSLGGRLEGETVHVVRIPDKLSPGSLVTEGLVYPSPLASLSQAVEALLREPCGCFEQTSSSNYPNVMVLQYLSTHAGVDPAIVARANKLLDAGYKRLVSFECKQKGYEWFGGDPGHEALSAYGVLEFTDMAAVYPVDEAMLTRTRAWLLSKRDGKGGYLRNARALDSFGGAPTEVTDAYVTWALSQARVPGIEKEVAQVRERAAGTEDAYLLALSANVLLDTKDAAANEVLARLAKKQDAGGSWKGAATSITRSGGESLEIETTSLAVLAFLRSPPHVAVCEKAMQWLLERAKGGRFGATQSTILALKAIVAYDAAHATPKKAGSILLEVDGKVYDEVGFTADRQGPIVLPSFAEALGPGEHKVKVKLVGGTPMPYSLSVRYHSLVPASAPGCKVALSTKLVSDEVKEGEAVDLRVELSNLTKEGLPMTVAIVGLPGGLESRADQLKELVKQGKIDFFETRGRDVVLYRRGMAPEEKSSFVLSLVAAIPGTYTGPASRAYLYYTDEDKAWVAALKVTIKP